MYANSVQTEKKKEKKYVNLEYISSFVSSLRLYAMCNVFCNFSLSLASNIFCFIYRYQKYECNVLNSSTVKNHLMLYQGKLDHKKKMSLSYAKFTENKAN